MQYSWAQLRKERMQLSPGLGFNTEQLGLHRPFHAADFELLSRCSRSNVSFRHSISGAVGHCPPICLSCPQPWACTTAQKGRITALLRGASQGAEWCLCCPPVQLVPSNTAGGKMYLLLHPGWQSGSCCML